MEFSEQLWHSITPIYDAILRHPFIQGLADGTLPRESFQFYILQDALYLREYARALSIAAARAPRAGWIIMFNEHAAGALQVERSLHEKFFEDWGLSPVQVAATEPAPTNLAYTSNLLAVAYGREFHQALGALLPCYWIYWEVGKELERRGSRDPLYRRWIDTYASEQFGALVRHVIAVVDAMAPGLTPDEREAMRRCFVTTSRYEWMFWEMGYKREAWPV